VCTGTPVHQAPFGGRRKERATSHVMYVIIHIIALSQSMAVDYRAFHLICNAWLRRRISAARVGYPSMSEEIKQT